MGKVKIVHVITRCDQGGSAEDTLALISGYNKQLEVILVRGLTTESQMSNEERQVVERAIETSRKKGVTIIDLPPLVRKISPLNDFKSFWRLFSIFRKEKPQIVHTHTSKAGILGRWAAYFARVPVIIHTPHGHIFHGYFNFLLTQIFKYIEIVSALITDKIIAVSDQEKKDYLANRVGDNDKILTAYSAVDLNRFMDLDIDVKTKRKELGIPSDHFVVGTTGRLVTVKGPEYLIRAAAEVVKTFPKTVFVFVGDGDLRAELESLAKELGISDNILFLGWRSNVEEFFHTFDIFVLPSLNEGMGKVLVEAMAAQKPIVASAVGGIVDLVQHGKNGFLVPPKDVSALARNITKLLQDRELAKQFGACGKKSVYPKFDIATRILKMEQVYDELLDRKGVLTDETTQYS